jgi:phage repressor protein C with HTH and peptisase S24 domain
MEYKDRIKTARKHAKLTQVELAKLVGIDQTSISDLERGKSQSSSYNARIAAACGVSSLWLEDGLGEMVDAGASSDQTTLVLAQGQGKTSTAADLVRAMLATKAGKALSTVAQERLMAAADTIPESSAGHSSNVIAGDFPRPPRLVDGDILIPQYDVRASMGHGQVPADYAEFVRNVVVSGPQLEKLGLEYTSPANLSIITGWGQSMAGTIEDKDPLIVDRGVTEFAGDGIYVLTWDDHLYIKRLQKADTDHFDLISDNPKHKDRVVHVDEVTIHARVLYVWRGMKV